MPMTAENYIPGVPLLPAKDFEAAKKKFTDYIFIRNDGRNAKNYRCTACGRGNRIEFPCRTYSSYDIDLFRAPHNSKAVCPMCEKTVEVKNLGITKKIENLRQTRAIIFVIPKGKNDVYFRCEFVYKDFCNIEPHYYNETYEVYHFKKGNPGEYFRCRYWYNRYDKVKTVREPFEMANMALGWTCYDYTTIGIERLEKTHLRYAYFCDGRFGTDINFNFRYLFIYEQYPKMTELLLKFGYHDLLKHKILGKKTRDVCKWKASSPKDFFKINKSELEEWKKYNNDVEILKIYTKLFKGRSDGFGLAKFVAKKIGGYYYGDILEHSKKFNITPADVVKYLMKCDGAFYLWRDYIEAAEALEYDLTVHNVLFPKNILQAHDDAIENRKIKEVEKDNEKAKKRQSELSRKYGFEKDGFIIRPPKDAAEIVKEGNALKHCVGGYAARHADGKTNILFMRKADAPDVPLYTIEIQGKDLIQVHGERNRKSPKDNPDSQAFFDEWLKAVKDGTLKKIKKQTAERAEIGA